MKVTQRIFRKFRPEDETPAFGLPEDAGSTQTMTIRAEVPVDEVDLPVTLSKFRYLWDWPASLSEGRPSWTEMSNYAHYAPWLFGDKPWIRFGGVWYHRLIARPVSAVARTVEAIFERPLRLIVAVFFTWWGWSLITHLLAR